MRRFSLYNIIVKKSTIMYSYKLKLYIMCDDICYCILHNCEIWRFIVQYILFNYKFNFSALYTAHMKLSTFPANRFIQTTDIFFKCTSLHWLYTALRESDTWQWSKENVVSMMRITFRGFLCTLSFLAGWSAGRTLQRNCVIVCRISIEN